MKILAVDDNQNDLMLLRSLVAKALPEADFLEARSGPACIEAACKEDPDVILLDIIMPGMDGFMTCRKLKEHQQVQFIPVVFLTGHGLDKDSRIRALEAGAEGFLGKPPDESELIAEIRAMVKIKAASHMQQRQKDQLAVLVAERTHELEQELAERKRVEAALRESEFFFKESQRAASIGSYKYDFNTGLRDASEVLTQIFGLDADCSRDIQKWLEIVHPDDREMLRQHIWEEVVAKQAMVNLEFRIIRKSDGEVRWVHGLGQVGLSVDGQVVSLIGTIRDVTDWKHAELELQESHDRLEKAVVQRTQRLRRLAAELTLTEQRERRRLADFLHDDLQQVHAAAMLAADKLMEGQTATDMKGEAEKLHKYLAEAINKTRSVGNELVPSLLYMLGFGAALRQLATQMQERHDLHIDLDIQDELDRFPESIKIQLFSFIQELLFNVAKHAGSRQANVGIKKDARRAEVTVSDTGKGFEWRPELATENKAGGYGLFRISEQLENLGGVLSITSVPGKGSCIKMVVPEAGHPVDSTE